MAKHKGVMTTYEPIAPIEVSIRRENDGDAELFIYGDVDVEAVRVLIQTAFGFVDNKPKSRKTEQRKTNQDNNEMHREMPKQRGRPRKMAEATTEQKELVA